MFTCYCFILPKKSTQAFVKFKAAFVNENMKYIQKNDSNLSRSELNYFDLITKAIKKIEAASAEVGGRKFDTNENICHV